jgi:hypothetical protein
MYIIVHEYFDLLKNMRKYKKELIHFFLHDYFLYMWLAFSVRNFELNELKN